jgi:DNA helicase HerA-like ATPase
MYLRDENVIWIAQGEERVCLLPRMANRHGLIAGATGTGKTTTLKVLAEGLSDAGVPVFLADIKGDVSGMVKPGEPNESVDSRVAAMGIEGFSHTAYPVRFWDVFGHQGIPVRTTISQMGPELLARIMELTEVQAEFLAIVFMIADDHGWMLTDTKYLKEMVAHVAENRKDYELEYGGVTTQSVASIQRNVVHLESIGGDIFFGEPELDLADWMTLDESGRGVINLLSCAELVQRPLLYSTFLLWMLSELYERLPEAGDLDKPKLVFFFDEAHLLFTDAPRALLTKVEQVARLIRSKGVGVYFITQVPTDIPDTVLAQLGNKIQHALRAYTPKEQKSVRAAAAGFRANPAFDSEQVLGELGTGEALISTLDAAGVPSIVQRAKVLPPRSFMGVAEAELIAARVAASPLYGKYAGVVDNISAYEQLTGKVPASPAAPLPTAAPAESYPPAVPGSVPDPATYQPPAVDQPGWPQYSDALAEQEKLRAQQEKARLQEEKQRAAAQAKLEKEAERERRAAEKRAEKRNAAVTRVVTNTVSSIGRELGRQVTRGIFGNLLK